jgi:hypothetical protein
MTLIGCECAILGRFSSHLTASRMISRLTGPALAHKPIEARFGVRPEALRNSLKLKPKRVSIRAHSGDYLLPAGGGNGRCLDDLYRDGDGTVRCNVQSPAALCLV